MGEAEVRVDAANAAVETLQSEVAGAVAALTDLPDIPNLHAHWDAGSLGLADGTRIASWLDEVSGRDAAQATAGNQPAYVANAINGRPGVYFDTTRVDRLVATIAPSNPQATMFVVVKPSATTVTRYLLGANTSVKSIFYTSDPGWGLQSGVALQANGLGGVPQILSGVFNGASSTLQIDAVATAGDVGTLSTASTSLTIGHRASLYGNAFDGTLCEVLWYDRVLSGGELTAIEQYLGAKYGIGTGVQTVWHVNSVTGNDANTGRSPAAPIKTMERLLQGVRATAPIATPKTAYIDAPEESPLRLSSTFFIDFAATVRLLAATPGRPWHAIGSERIVDTWTDVGGGIYSHALVRNNASGLQCHLPEVLDPDGHPLRVLANASSQTAPDEGEYGWASDVYYVHLPGGINPSGHAVEIPLANSIVQAQHADASIVVEDAVLTGGRSAGIYAGLGRVVGRRVLSQLHGTNGFGTIADAGHESRYESCIGRLCPNDGFNLQGSGFMALVDCDGSWNVDEGASPHSTSVMAIAGGRYHHNGSAGITAVNQSVLDLLPYQGQPIEVDHNRRLYMASPGSGDRGGLVALDTVTANVYALHAHDNPGPGVSRQSTVTWNVLGTITSGTGQGNGTEDEVV